MSDAARFRISHGRQIGLGVAAAAAIVASGFWLRTRTNSMDGGAATATARMETSPLIPLWREPPAEFQQPAGHLAMLSRLKELYQYEQDFNSILGETNLHRLRARLKDVTAATPIAEQFAAYHQLGIEELNQGNDKAAVEYLDRCWQIFTTRRLQLSRREVENFVFNYGMANLRFGETQNCCARNGPDNCVMPIQGGGIHAKQQGSRRAIEIFSQYLGRMSRGEKLYWRAMWLLNIAYMTVDEYPAKVPLDYLLPPESFASDEPFPRFANVAPRVGLDLYALAGAVIVDDFNNDGYLDVLISGWDLGTQLRLFLSQRDGTFLEWTKQSGLVGIVGGSNLMQADYNNDGYLDIFLMRAGWLGQLGVQPVSLLRNNGDGTFTDVTIDAGLTAAVQPSHSGGWADYDNDGWLDLYVCGEYLGEWNQPIQEGGHFASCRLYHNNRDGSFTEVTKEAGVENNRFAKGAVWGDYDGDRLPDLYVSNYTQANRLYHNNGDGTFTDVAVELGVSEPINSFTCWFWDVDNDGLLDLYVAAYEANPEDIAASCLGIETNIDHSCLYRGLPGGGFAEVSEEYKLRRPSAPMSANFGDLDNDGYLDFYLGTGRPYYWALTPNLMYHNRGGKSFSDVTTAGGFGNLQKGHGIAFADLDNDGDQEVFSQMGGAIRADKFYNTLYENPGFGNHWLSVRLVGTQSNRSAIGARIRAQIVEDGQPRSVYKHVNSGGSFGASPLRQSLGLGKAEMVERLEIFWPTTGKTEVFENVPVDTHITIIEGQGQYLRTPLASFRLGGDKP